MIFGITLRTQVCGTKINKQCLSWGVQLLPCYAPGNKSNFSGQLCHGSAHTLPTPPMVSYGAFCHHTRGLTHVPCCDPPWHRVLLCSTAPLPSASPMVLGTPQPVQGNRQEPIQPGAVAGCPSPTGCPLAGGPVSAATARPQPPLL